MTPEEWLRTPQGERWTRRHYQQLRSLRENPGLREAAFFSLKADCKYPGQEPQLGMYYNGAPECDYEKFGLTACPDVRQQISGTEDG